MTDSETISDDKIEPKNSELAVASFLIPIIVASAWLISWTFLLLYSQEYNGVPFSTPFLLLIAFLLSITLFLFVAPLFAWISIIKIKKSNGLLKGSYLAYWGLTLSIIGLGFLAYLRFYPYVVIVMMLWDILELKLRGL
jgi:hypothetical protein